MSRESGVLLPLFSLPGGYSVGSAGEAAFRFIDRLAEGGFSLWQVLPFCLPGEGDSPYKSYSAFSYNYALIDLPDLFSRGLLTQGELAAAREETPYLCEYERVARERFDLLARAAGRLGDRSPVYSFLENNPGTERFCRFMALRRQNGNRPWRLFETDKYDEEYYFAWAFSQYTFCRQWAAVRCHAAERGVRIMGDIPIYVDYESADVWAERELFLLDRENKPAAVAGVPPDYFSETGQLWGNPLYNWERMKTDGYAWWQERLRHTLASFDRVRIDHFRAFASYYYIPAEAEDARTGHWCPGPGEELIDRLRSVAAKGQIVAEDLGGEAPEVKALLAYSGFPGMRVFQFGFLSGENSSHLPHNYEKNVASYTGTHDNDTLLGYLFSLSEGERRRVFDYCGYAGDRIEEGIHAVIRTMYASHADLLVLPVQDLLGFGADTRINRPGTPRGNWTYRVTEEQLAAVDWARYRRLSELYGRK